MSNHIEKFSLRKDIAKLSMSEYIRFLLTFLDAILIIKLQNEINARLPDLNKKNKHQYKVIKDN